MGTRGAEQVSTPYTVQKWSVVGDLLISVTSAGVVSDQDWQQFMKALRTEPVTKYLAGTLGKAEATSTQRKEGAEVMMRRGLRVAVITDDAITRGIITAVGWLGANVSSFNWSNIDAALSYLNVTEVQASRAHDTLAILRAAVETAKRS